MGEGAPAACGGPVLREVLLVAEAASGGENHFCHGGEMEKFDLLGACRRCTALRLEARSGADRQLIMKGMVE